MAKKYRYASLYTLRSDGRYQGTYIDHDGKRKYVYDKNPDVLHEKIAARQAPKEPTFKDIAELWHEKNWDNLRLGTQSCYSAPYRRAVEEYGDRPASSLTPYDIDLHLKVLLSQQYSAKVIKTQRTIYKLIYDNAIIDEHLRHYIKSNPAAITPLPKNLPKPVKREAPEDDIVNKIRSSVTTVPFGLFALFLMSTGFRRGEALAIQWKDIDLTAGTISCTKSVSHRTGAAVLSTTKTAAGIRSVPILPDLREHLTKPAESKPEDFLFHGACPSKPLVQSTYQRKWLNYCIAMGFAEDDPEIYTDKRGTQRVRHHYKTTLTAHCLRHGYATLLFEAGVDDMTAQKLIGHANIETTRAVYTHLRNKQQQSSIDRLIAHVEQEISK